MAGPLSSEEIEDVVSSVRRLVSNEQRPRTLSRDLNSERLLLTPALRVVSETSPLAPLVLDAPLHESAPVVAETDVLVPQPEAGPDAAPEPLDVVEVDGHDDHLPGDGQTLLVGDEMDQPVAEEPNAPEAAFVEVAADWEDEIWTAPEGVSLGEAALAAEDAEVLAAAVPGDASPDLVDADASAEPVADASGDWSEDEPIPFVPLRRRAENLAARLAAGEGADSPHFGAEDQERPIAAEGSSDEPAATNAQAAGSGATVDHMTTELLDADGTPLAVLDEAALQDIVRQTIHAELQGDLGERITRNVRKLVRAEINRALVARDLD